LPMVSSASSIPGPTIASTSSFHGPAQPRASNSSAPPLESLSRFTPLTVNQAYSQRGAKAPLTIVESLAGNENLEVQWRLATLREAKAVVTQYHKYLSDHSLIKTVFDETPSLLPPGTTTHDNPSD